MAGASNDASPGNPTRLPGTEGILGAGYQPVPGADTAPVVYQVNGAGQLDTTFGTSGVFSQSPLAEPTESYAVALQPGAGGGYKLVTTGYGRQLATETTDLVSPPPSTSSSRATWPCPSTPRSSSRAASGA